MSLCVPYTRKLLFGIYESTWREGIQTRLPHERLNIIKISYLYRVSQNKALELRVVLGLLFVIKLHDKRVLGDIIKHALFQRQGLELAGGMRLFMELGLFSRVKVRSIQQNEIWVM